MWTLKTCTPLTYCMRICILITINANNNKLENDEMKIYRHRIKLDDSTREKLTEKYGNNFEGQYLLLYYPYLEVNIWDLPNFIEEFSADGFRLDSF